MNLSHIVLCMDDMSVSMNEILITIYILKMKRYYFSFLFIQVLQEALHPQLVNYCEGLTKYCLEAVKRLKRLYKGIHKSSITLFKNQVRLRDRVLIKYCVIPCFLLLFFFSIFLYCVRCTGDQSAALWMSAANKHTDSSEENSVYTHTHTGQDFRVHPYSV